MITTKKVPVHTTSDGKTFTEWALAQSHEIGLLLSDKLLPPSAEEAIDAILKHREALVDILTTTPNSLPKARAIHGGKKPRKAKSGEATPTETTP